MFISRHLCEAVEYNPQFRDKELKDCDLSKVTQKIRGRAKRPKMSDPGLLC